MAILRVKLTQETRDCRSVSVGLSVRVSRMMKRADAPVADFAEVVVANQPPAQTAHPQHSSSLSP
jgi:hypothetical protein